MNEKKPTSQSILSKIGSVVAVLLINCIFITSEVQAQLSDFAAEIQDRIQNDIVRYWDDENSAAIAARAELNVSATTTIKDGLNGMLRGRNLDPGQTYVWESSGIDGFILHYPRPDYPEVAVKRVHYMSFPYLDTPSVLFSVDWDARWRGLSHTDHNGPYIYFRLTGGYLWARYHDVQVHIDRMDMTMHGSTLFAIGDDGTVRSETQGGSGFHPWALPDMYHIRYVNPNPRRWRHRVGNRIIAEIERNYSNRIKMLIFETLLADFMTERMGGEITTGTQRDNFWERWTAWGLEQESGWGTYIVDR